MEYNKIPCSSHKASFTRIFSVITATCFIVRSTIRIEKAVRIAQYVEVAFHITRLTPSIVRVPKTCCEEVSKSVNEESL